MTCARIPPFFSTPTLDNKVVQGLQQLFINELSAWLQLCYPTAQVGKTTDGEQNVYKYPQVYQNDGTENYYDVRPNDDLQSFGFFELNSSVALNDDEIKYNLSFVCWYNMNLVDVSRTDNYSRDLAKDVLRAINESETYAHIVDGLEIEFNPEKVFDKYSFEDNESKYLMYPYGAFKITFDVIDTDVPSCTAMAIIGGTGCSGTQKTPCQLLIDSLTADQLNTCILPNYNFGSTSVTNNFTAAQILQLQALYGGVSTINVRNSDSSYSVNTSSNLVLPDETISVYVNGVLNQTGTYIPLDTTAINITV